MACHETRGALCPRRCRSVKSGHIVVDLFQCPARPDLVTQISESYPLYVHVPLHIGQGLGDAVDDEAHAPADWGRIEALLLQTGTPFVNLHLAPTTVDCPDIPAATTKPAHVAA